MVKRAKTPEANEEAKYYTCWSPYPNNPDFELSEHYIPFSRWIANILEDSNVLHSLYYKPGHGMVIFAVDKTYRRTERLLGEHRWSEFLKKPKNDEHDLVSKIFYSTYSTDREVQKDGWKCIFVEEYFFMNWGIDKWFTKVPYPAPHWCDVPSENRVHKALCRPLPVAQVPRPVPSLSSLPSPRPVVGSADWAQTKATTNSQRATPRGRGNAAPAGRGVKTNKQTNAKPTWGQGSFPALDSKAPAPKKIIPGLSSPTAPPVQSAWGNRPSESAPTPSSPRRSALAPPENSTAHQVWAKNKSSTTQSAASSSTWENSPSGSGNNTPPAKPQNAKGKNVPKPSPVVTTTNAKKGKNATTSSSHPGKSKDSNSGSSSSQSECSNTASPPSSAPSSPSLSAVSFASESVSGSVQINPSEYYNDYEDDEELTEETYYENWETASVYEPNESDSIAVRIGSNDKEKGKLMSPVTTSKTKTRTSNLWPEDNPQPSSSSSSTPVNLWEEPEPVKQEPVIDLWVDSKPNLRPTGRASAVEARAVIGEEILCPHHKGKCPRGVCKAYKEEKKRVEKLWRQQEKQKQKVEEGKEEKRKAKAKEEGESGEKKEAEEETKKVDQERPVASKKGSKESKKKAEEEKKKAEEEKKKAEEEKKKAEEEKKKVEDGRKKAEEEKKESKKSKKKVEEETPMEDTVVTPTPSPPPSNDQGNKKLWADYEIDDDSDFGDLPDFGGKRFYADEDYEFHQD